MTKIITVQFEVDDEMTPKQLHELLCLSIHEQGGPTIEMEALKEDVIDIQVMDEA